MWREGGPMIVARGRTGGSMFVAHHTVPMHDSLRIGTLAAVVDAVGEHLGLDRDEVVEALFG